MNFAGPLSRIVALAGLTIATMSAVAPAYAAKADVELVQSYIGSWKGGAELQGKFRGKEAGKVSCTMSLSAGNADKVNFAGNCALAGTTMTVRGTIVYNDKGKRYEAAMSTNVGFSGLAIGKRQGNGILFSFKEKNKGEEATGGMGMDVDASISLNPDKINVNFKVAFDNGEGLSASVPFAK
jgi:hypothetical protein